MEKSYVTLVVFAKGFICGKLKNLPEQNQGPSRCTIVK